MSWEIRQATTAVDISSAHDLFLEYAQWLGHDLYFQGFKEELATLPGDYAPPSGRLFISAIDQTSVGCVALRPRPEIGQWTCEMKRLYVRPEARGTGLGKALAQTIIEEARLAGYQRMVLDTLDTMEAALGLYRSLGFRPCPAYYYNPLP